MMNVFKLDVELKVENRGVSVIFKGGIGSKISEIITEKEEKKIIDLITEISDIANNAIERDLHESIDLEKKLSPEIKEKIRKIEERMNNLDLESPEDVLDFLSKMLEGK